MSLIESIIGQFRTLPYPDEDCSGRTIIVTGANCGLGLEAARHFVRLNAAKVIIGCRNVDKGAAALADIEHSTQRVGVVDAWHLDLCSFQSVKDFAARAAELDRLDGLVNNASILVMGHELQEGHEIMVTVNVISTLLLTLLLLPKLRQTAAKFNITPHVTIVSSLGAFLTFFPQRHADSIFEELKKGNYLQDRYNATKLIQLIMMRKLATAVDTSGKGRVVFNAVNPGLCSTQLFRRVYFPLNILFSILFVMVARTPEMGSRTLMGGVFAGDEMHGKFMSDCREQNFPGMMVGEEGEMLDDRVWGELLEIMEGIEVGVTRNL